MLQYRDGKYFATQVRMLLNSGHVRACVVGPPDETAGLSYPGVTPLVVGDKDSFAECVAMLGDVRTLRLQRASSLITTYGGESVLVYRNGVASASSEQRVQAMRASELARATPPVHHVNISEFDVASEEMATSRVVPLLRSLDLSRLQLDHAAVATLVRYGRFQNLKWLDLSGNPGITFATVEVIAAFVQSGALPCLEWLDLLGTDCDATPYVDGYHWRMAEPARQLAKTFGYQPWMMLASKIPEMANRELLTDLQRRIPPDRFSLP